MTGKTWPSFLNVSDGWLYAGTERISLINVIYMSTGDCLVWWRFYGGMGSINLAWYWTLIRLHTTLIGDRCVSILSDHLHLFMSTVHPKRFAQFQRDKATFHTSNADTGSLQKQPYDFRHFHCYTNPWQEHYWPYLKCLTKCCLEEIFRSSHFYVDFPAVFLMRIIVNDTWSH